MESCFGLNPSNPPLSKKSTLASYFPLKFLNFKYPHHCLSPPHTLEIFSDFLWDGMDSLWNHKIKNVYVSKSKRRPTVACPQWW